MRHDFDTALDQCLAWMREGTDIETCLARYPEYTHEMRPLLALVPQFARVHPPAPAHTARAAAEERMLAALAQRRERQAHLPLIIRYLRRGLRTLMPGRPGTLRPAWQTVAMLLAVALIATASGALAASAGSLPGDALYPLKLASQRAQLALTVDPARQKSVQDRFYTQRRLDTLAALKAGRQATAEFQGVLQEVEGDLWTVGGVPVMLQDSTVVIGRPTLGALLHVRGDLTGGTVFSATRIAIEATPLPLPTVTPEFTPTPWPTSTPEPAETPIPTDTTEPSRTPAPTTSPMPSQTPTPRSTSRSMDSLQTTPTTESVTKPATSEAQQPAVIPVSSEGPQPSEEVKERQTPVLREEGPADETEPAGTSEAVPAPESTEEPEATVLPESEEKADPAREVEPTETLEVDEDPESSDGPEHDQIKESAEEPEPTKGAESTEEKESDEEEESANVPASSEDSEESAHDETPTPDDDQALAPTGQGTHDETPELPAEPDD